MKKSVIILFYIICISQMLSITCYAYIDPASTSYIIQIGAGIVIALGTVIGICWNKITRLFKKKNTTDDATGPAITNDADEKEIITADDLMDD